MSETTVAVLYPTRGRAEQAKELAGDMLAQLYPDGVRVTLVASVEDSDHETIEVMTGLAEKHPGNVVILARAPLTTSIYGWNQAYAYARDVAEWVVLGADDVVWKEGWLQTALDTARERGAALVGLHDGHDPHRKYGPHYIARVDFLEEHMGGVMSVPHYGSWGSDYEVSARADRAGLYASAPGTPINHLHPVWGLSERDDTYNAAWHKHEADRVLRQKRARQGYPTDYEPAQLEGEVINALSVIDATDAAAALADEHGLDLHAIKGSGVGGRILKGDVESVLEEE